MKKKKSSKMADTVLVKERFKDSVQLETQRLDIQRELEEAIAEYAALTGYKRLKVRKHKVGDAPNDWHKRV